MNPMSRSTDQRASSMLSGISSAKYGQQGELTNAAANYRSARDRAQKHAESQVDAARSQANNSITNSIIGAAADIGTAGFGAMSAAKKAAPGINYDPTGYQKAANAWSLDSLTLPPWMSK